MNFKNINKSCFLICYKNVKYVYKFKKLIRREENNYDLNKTLMNSGTRQHQFLYLVAVLKKPKGIIYL